MSTAELNKIKLNLIAWIIQISDADLIAFLDGIRSSRSKGDWWDELSGKQKKIIVAGLIDAEDGKIISSTEFWKKLKIA
jgi:hypothetical protein